MTNDQQYNRIQISIDWSAIISILGIIINLWLFALGIYWTFTIPFGFTTIFSLIFVALPIYLIDNFVFLASASIDEEYLYLEKFFVSKKIPLSHIESQKQRMGLKRNYEPLIVLKIRESSLLFRKVYIIPNNCSFGGKVSDHKIFRILGERIEKVKNAF